MQRRLALTIAGSGALVVAAASTAVAANLGLLGVQTPDADQVGDLDAANVAELVSDTSTTSIGDPVVVYVDEYVTVPGAPGASGSVASAPGPLPSGSVAAGAPAVPATPVAGGAAPVGEAYDDEYEDEEHEDEDEHDDEYEDEHEDEDEEDHEDD